MKSKEKNARSIETLEQLDDVQNIFINAKLENY